MLEAFLKVSLQTLQKKRRNLVLHRTGIVIAYFYKNNVMKTNDKKSQQKVQDKSQKSKMDKNNEQSKSSSDKPKQKKDEEHASSDWGNPMGESVDNSNQGKGI
jgi:hypothetical protein